ncbi:MAG: YezD family protein [Negativicutes bacterium]|nr:YezD family protein [Negativicutes bacterium]
MDVPEQVWEIIEAEVGKIRHGMVTLIAQDGRLIQIDKTEKIRLIPAETVPRQGGGKAEVEPRLNSRQFRQSIGEVLQGLRFGQVVIVIKDNKVVQIEKAEKRRFSDLAGLFGEGI